MPWARINRMGNILKTACHFIAKLANVIESHNPPRHPDNRSEYIEIVASIDVLLRRMREKNEKNLGNIVKLMALTD